MSARPVSPTVNILPVFIGFISRGTPLRVDWAEAERDRECCYRCNQNNDLSSAWTELTRDNTTRNGSPPSRPLHLVHLSDVPHSPGSQTRQESPLVLVHSLHTSLALRHDTPRQVDLLHHIGLQGWHQGQAGETEDHRQESLQYIPCAPADRRPGHALHQT